MCFVISGSRAYAQGANISTPIVVNTLYTGSYYDSRNNSGYGNDIGQPSDDVFYKFTLPVSRTVTISTCGSAFDTYLHLLDASGSQITYNDDSGPSCYTVEASITYTLAAGTYYVAVEGYASLTGTYQLTLSCTPFTPVLGKDMSSPIDIGALFPGASYSDTKNNDPANGFGNDMGQPSDDIYYKFSISGTQTVNISTCNSALGDTYLHILNSAGTEIYYDDDNGPACAGLKASLSVSLTAGTYYIVTEGWNTNYGNISLDVDIPGGGTTINTAFAQQMNSIIAHLENNRVPYGLLKDIAFEAINLDNYDGVLLADSNYVNQSIMGRIYNTVRSSVINTTNAGTFLSLDTIETRVHTLKHPGKIVLEGMFYHYSKLADNAVSNGQISISGNQLYDVYQGGVWQNPYEIKTTFAIAPTSTDVEGLNQQFVLPASLWLTNSGADVAGIQLDAGDGLGYRNVTIGSNVSVTYPDTGRYVMQMKLTLTNSTILYSHAEVTVSNTAASFCPTCIVMDIPANSNHSGATITIHNRTTAGLRKPLIIAEGFDPGSILTPEKEFGTNSYRTFHNDLINSRPASAPNTPTELENILFNPIAANNQYDIVYVDWKDGMDDIKRNAAALEDVIRNVNSLKATAGSSQNNVVMGISMGALAARWALKEMENNSENHQTNLYISYDGPHQGANVPLGAQYALRHLKSFALSTPAGDWAYFLYRITSSNFSINSSNLLDVPAARQMVINYVNNDKNIDNSVHNAWQNDLKNMGYPNGVPGIPFRKIAVSDGSACGNLQDATPGSTLMSVNGNLNTNLLGDLLGMVFAPSAALLVKPQLWLGILPGKNEIKLDIGVHAINNGGGNEVYHGKISYKKMVVWVLPVELDLTNETKYAPSGMLSYDSYAGGFYNTLDHGELLQHSGLLGSYNISISQPPNFSYVPTVSSLDIGAGNIALTDWDYRKPYNGATPPVSPDNTTPFANFITATEDNSANQYHTQISSRTGDWLADELTEGTATQCASACSSNSVIAGPQVVCYTQSYTVSNLPPGTIVNWSIPGGAPAWASVNWDPVTYAATVSTGNPNGQLLTLTATVVSACNDTLILTKNINMGVPPPSIIGSDQLCTNDMSDYMVNAVDGATGYHWSSPDPGVTLTPYSGGQAVHFRASTAGNYTLSLYIDTPCSSLLIPDMYIWVHDCGGGGDPGGGPYYYRYQGYPNPADGIMTITSQAESSASAQGISVFAKTSTTQTKANDKLKPVAFTYRIMDAKGKVWRQGHSQKGEDVKADVRQLPDGIYYLHFIAGKDVVRRQIIIKH